MCPAAEAIALRDTVRMAAAQGQSVDQIVEGVVARYGERVRTLPRRDDFGVWAWLAPPLVLILGAFAVFFAIRRLRGRGGDAVAPASPMTDEDRARLDAALRAFERGEANV
jgi:cytochrome c-type biogenesis protein CcmH